MLAKNLPRKNSTQLITNHRSLHFLLYLLYLLYPQKLSPVDYNQHFFYSITTTTTTTPTLYSNQNSLRKLII